MSLRPRYGTGLRKLLKKKQERIRNKPLKARRTDTVAIIVVALVVPNQKAVQSLPVMAPVIPVTATINANMF